MKYAIDRIENNIAICQNLTTGEIVEIERNNLPANIKDGTIIKYINGKYILDKDTELEIRRRIIEKMNRLRNLQ